MRQNIKWLSILFVGVALLFGCSSNDDSTDQKQGDDGTNNSTPNTSEGTNEETIVDAPYSFIDLEIEVDIDGVEDALDIEYEVERSKIDASYKNKEENIDVKDEEALAEIEPMLDSFTFDENSSEDEILEQVLDAFSIESYDEIEVEVTFKDESKIEFER